MKVIFEGPDGSGKSTAIEYIKKRTSWGVIASGGPLLCRDDLNKRLETICNLPKDQNFLLDRCLIISEPIYQKIFKRPKILNENVAPLEWLFFRDAVIVSCKIPWEVHTKYYDSSFNKDHNLMSDQFVPRKKIFTAYKKYFKDLKERYKIIDFDYTKTTLDNLFKEIKNECQRYHRE